MHVSPAAERAQSRLRAAQATEFDGDFYELMADAEFAETYRRSRAFIDLVDAAHRLFFALDRIGAAHSELEDLRFALDAYDALANPDSTGSPRMSKSVEWSHVMTHKPYARLDRELIEGDIHDRHRKAVLFCSCGWEQSFGPNGHENFFDHLLMAREVERLRSGSLDAAWAEVAPFLPNWWHFNVQGTVDGDFRWTAENENGFREGEGPTPAAALHALAAKLREAKS
jgi:hypothetical protein